MTGYIIQELPVRRGVIFPYFIKVKVVEFSVCGRAIRASRIRLACTIFSSPISSIASRD